MSKLRFIWEVFLCFVWCAFILCVVAVERVCGYGHIREITEEDKDHFWRVVGLCLVEFHSYDVNRAEEAVAAYRTRMKSRETGAFYHGEPFYIANDIAGAFLRLGEGGYRSRYESLKWVGHEQ